MPTYSNGYVPLELLVTFKRGWNSTDGDWHHSLSAATYARHLALVSRAKARTGRTLAISLGWSAYRPYAAQVIARKVWGMGAAQPGTSSHGGFWEGKQTLAMDYGNWDWVYENDGGQGAFFDDCRAVGLAPGQIMRSRGYPDEPWHVIDLNPWSAVPAFDSSTPFESEEDDMYTDADRVRDQNTYAAVWTGGAVTVDGVARKFNYGILPIVAHNQTLIAKQAGQLAAIAQVVEQLTAASGVALDMAAIEAAAERGAAAALDGLTLKAE